MSAVLALLGPFLIAGTADAGEPGPFPQYERALAEVARASERLDKAFKEHADPQSTLQPLRMDLERAEAYRDDLLVEDSPSPAFQRTLDRAVGLRDTYQRKLAEVMERYGRTDLPEAQAILGPIQSGLNEAVREKENWLAGEWVDPKPILARLGIGTYPSGRPNDDDVRAYVQTRVADGTLTSAAASKLLYIISKRTERITHPDSKGAGEYAHAVTQTLARFRVDRR